MDSRPALQYNLAQAYERLGRYDEAVRAYEVYIAAAAPDDQRAQNARGRVAQLQQRLGNTAVVCSGGPDGAQSFGDGSRAPRTPIRCASIPARTARDPHGRPGPSHDRGEPDSRRASRSR
jgi:tetratricopeptide (TPR) repeat protein